MTITKEMQILAGVLVALGAYFIGNINNAIFISKLKGKDIRTCGSGNPGTMNMIRTFGKIIGVLTLISDVAKGMIPCILGWLFMGDGEFLRLGGDRIGLYVAGLCVTLGHVYPVLMKFKGGKGVATILGVCLTAQPLWTIAFFAFGVGFLFLTKIGSMTSFIMMCAPLAVEGITAANNPLGALCAVIVFLLYCLTLFAHRGNLVKMFSGNEGRVVLKKSKKPKKAVERSIAYSRVIIAE